MKIENIAVDCSAIEVLAVSTGQSVATLATAFVEGCFSGSYRFDDLKSGKLDKKQSDQKSKGIVLRSLAGPFPSFYDWSRHENSTHGRLLRHPSIAGANNVQRSCRL